MARYQLMKPETKDHSHLFISKQSWLHVRNKQSCVCCFLWRSNHNDNCKMPDMQLRCKIQLKLFCHFRIEKTCWCRHWNWPKPVHSWSKIPGGKRLSDNNCTCNNCNREQKFNAKKLVKNIRGLFSWTVSIVRNILLIRLTGLPYTIFIWFFMETPNDRH